MAGLNVTPAQTNQRLGQLCQDLRRSYEDVVQLNNFFLDHPIVNGQGVPVAADVFTPPNGGSDPLVALGFAPADLPVLRQAAADLAYQKATAFDSSAAVKKLWGIGS